MLTAATGLDISDMCGKSPRYIIETAFNIVDKKSKLVPFGLNSCQSRYDSALTRRDIILKARKQGFSTYRLARMVAKCMTMKYRKCVVVSHEQDATERLLARAHHYIETSAIGIKTTRKAANHIGFPDTESSIWIGTAGQRAFGRGDDITDYHLSEFAFWPNPDIITGIEEACLDDSEGCIETTANGWGTKFHQLWQRAVSGRAGIKTGEGKSLFYNPFFSPWFADPGYQTFSDRPLENKSGYEMELQEEDGVDDSFLRWRRAHIDGMYDPEMFPQEYPATPEEAFLVSGLMYFDGRALQRHAKAAREVLWTGEIVDHG